MPSILDVAPPEPASKEVTIRGNALTLRGIVGADWAQLYARFPELRRVVTGQVNGEVSEVGLFAATAAMIAAGMGQIGKADIERAVMTNLTADEMNDLTREVIGLSHPGALFSPLLDAAAEDAADLSTAAPATK